MKNKTLTHNILSIQNLLLIFLTDCMAPVANFSQIASADIL